MKTRNGKIPVPIFTPAPISNFLPKELKKLKFGEKYCIVTDSTVEKLFGIKILKSLRENGIKAEMISFSPGETHKNLKTIEKLASKMAKKGFNRKDAIIALGGGVVGDIGGFLASIYMRGISYIQIPTTLLAMADSSIGGKTGVDLAEGKNLIGTITQPEAVYIDMEFLEKLPKKQIRNGLAEIIKCAVIRDKKLFNFIEQNVEKIMALEAEELSHSIKRATEIKHEIVEQDEKEKGLRMILNYGHTYGHVLEKLSGYKLLHGHAISIGMVLANKIAVEKNLLEKEEEKRIKNLLIKTGLPVSTMKKITIKDLLNDKKTEGGFINLILPKSIGEVTIHKEKCQ